MTTNKSSSGFTLIELMIVVVIISILAAISYPSHRDSVVRAKGVEAEGLLLELTFFMERFFTENGVYDFDAAGVAVVLPITQSPNDGTENPDYLLTFVGGVPTATTFVISAQPQDGQLADSDCGILTIDQAGVTCINNQAQCSNGDIAAQAAVAACW